MLGSGRTGQTVGPYIGPLLAKLIHQIVHQERIEDQVRSPVALIHHFESYKERFSVTARSTCAAVEASRGEFDVTC